MKTGTASTLNKLTTAVIETRKSADKVWLYAKKREWNVSGLPEQGVCLEVLARIITIAEANGMHLGRWSGGFRAIYAAFIGKTRPRSHSKHGFWPWGTRGTGGITSQSDVCRELVAYEKELIKLTAADWADARKQASQLAKPRKAERPVACGAETGDAKPVATKPCLTLDYCPYGVLVEQFPTSKPGDQRGCEVYGHLCPTFVVAERRSPRIAISTSMEERQ